MKTLYPNSMSIRSNDKPLAVIREDEPRLPSIEIETVCPYIDMEVSLSQFKCLFVEDKHSILSSTSRGRESSKKLIVSDVKYVLKTNTKREA